MLNEHVKWGSTEWWVPALANKETLTGTGQLPKFEEDLFKTTEGLYLIPTAEVMLTNLHANEVLDGSELPIRYCAYTPWLPRGGGQRRTRHARHHPRAPVSTRLRWCRFANPEKSDAELEDMTACAEKILQELGLPYRVISLCTGDLGFSARQTYDLEVWLPSYGAYKEISSCSNCGDFQARRANIKYVDEDGRKRFAHTLNGSGLAVGRTWLPSSRTTRTPTAPITVPEAPASVHGL